jgi:hypothetical protein
MKPSWDTAPEWANYLARDADDSWNWFEEMPYASDYFNEWRTRGRTACAAKGTSWDETLEERPKQNEVTQKSKMKLSGKVREGIDNFVVDSLINVGTGKEIVVGVAWSFSHPAATRSEVEHCLEQYHNLRVLEFVWAKPFNGEDFFVECESIV